MNIIWAILEGFRFLWACRIRRRFPWGLLPIPPLKYIKWRLETAYGPWRPPLKTIIMDVYHFLLWRRQMRLIGKLTDV